MLQTISYAIRFEGPMLLWFLSWMQLDFVTDQSVHFISIIKILIKKKHTKIEQKLINNTTYTVGYKWVQSNRHCRVCKKHQVVITCRTVLSYIPLPLKLASNFPNILTYKQTQMSCGKSLYMKWPVLIFRQQAFQGVMSDIGAAALMPFYLQGSATLYLQGSATLYIHGREWHSLPPW